MTQVKVGNFSVGAPSVTKSQVGGSGSHMILGRAGDPGESGCPICDEVTGGRECTYQGTTLVVPQAGDQNGH
jgi:hypothetical protein